MHHAGEVPHLRRLAVAALAIMLAVAVGGCAQQADSEGGASEASAPEELVLASTTSTQDSGLFDILIPAFEKANPDYKVKVIAVGTGEALKLGENKDADVLLVHAKSDEEKFVANGFGIERQNVMYNDFLIVGPSADPATVQGSEDTTDAMLAIEKAGVAGKAVFVSRGDDSGTHKKELKAWAAAGVEPTPTPEADEWYESTGQGMGETLKITSEKGAYTISDRASYLAMQDDLDLDVLFENDKGLQNQYGVIVVKDAKNQAGGQAFYDWILSEEAQAVIGDFGVEDYGQQLFVPNAE